MEKRKRDSLDSDGTSPKRFKNGPTVCQTEKEIYTLLRSKKSFVFSSNIYSFTLPSDCGTLEHLKRLTRALLDDGNQLQQFSIIHESEILTADRVASILQSLKNCSTLKSLVISSRCLLKVRRSCVDPERALAVTSPSRKQLLLTSFNSIVPDLIACTSLKSIDFSGYNSLIGIEKVVTQHKRLRSVKLADCTANNEAMATIIDFIQSSNSLTKLDLSDTLITIENFVKLGQSIEKNKTLTSLNINNGEDYAFPDTLGNQCGGAIAQMLKRNTPLTELKMRHIPLGVHEIEILNALETTDTVQELDISLDTKAGLNRLGEALENMTVLSKLVVDLPSQEGTSYAALANGIANNTTLKHLQLAGNIRSSEASLLKNALELNRTLLSMETYSDYSLRCHAREITERNKAIASFDRTTIKPFLDTKDWDGMWKFVEEHVAKGYLFEDLIDKNQYNLDDYEIILQTYLKKSAALHKQLTSNKKKIEKDIQDCNKTIETARAKIAEAERVIANSTILSNNATAQLKDFNSKLAKIDKKLIIENQSRERAESEYESVKEQTKGLAQQFKRPIETWSLDEVLMFVRDLQLHAFVEKFTENEIKGDVLINLTTLDFHQLGMQFKEIKSLMSSMFELKHFKSLSDIPDGMLYWTNEQVLTWLETNKFQHLVNQFRNCKITGEDLIVLDNYDLTHWLKIETIADKTALEAAIKKLRAEFEAPGNNGGVKKKVPKQYLCPITHEIMKEPVSTIDGHTYERKAIESWLKKKNTSPLTNETLASKQLIPNHQLKSLIAEFLGEAT